MSLIAEVVRYEPSGVIEARYAARDPPVCAWNRVAFPCTPRITAASAAGCEGCGDEEAGYGGTHGAREGSRVCGALRKLDALDHDVRPWAVARIGLECGDRVDDVHAAGHTTEHRVLAVEP